MIIMYMLNVACRLEAILVISYGLFTEFWSYPELVYTELPNDLYCFKLNVGIQKYLTNWSLHYLFACFPMDPD